LIAVNNLILCWQQCCALILQHPAIKIVSLSLKAIKIYLTLTTKDTTIYYSWIKIFNNLPCGIKNLSSVVIKFKLALKRFLLAGSFYSLNEYYEWNTRGELGSYNIEY
jgi:hypothetical protein